MDKQVSKVNSISQVIYGHYVFEMEVHPDEDPEGLQSDVRAMHIQRE